MVSPDGFGIIGIIFGNGVQGAVGSYELASFIAIVCVIGALAYIGVDVIASMCLGGLMALGMAWIGWLGPLQVVIMVVMIMWGLGFAYFVTRLYAGGG